MKSHLKGLAAPLALLILIVPSMLIGCSGAGAGSPAIGNRAPEIFGVDVDGNEMRLSDYLGKVVVLDFWGDW